MKHSMLILIFLALGCSPQIRVYSDHDPAYEVKNFNSFDWGQKVDIEKNNNPLLYNELTDKRIKTAVIEQLTNRGYSRSEVNPDLIIHYHIVVDNQSMVSTEPYGYNSGPYWMRTRTNVYSYRQGSLIIDLMDPKTNTLVWRGWATADLNTITPDQAEETIQRAIAKIFKRFSDSAKNQNP